MAEFDNMIEIESARERFMGNYEMYAKFLNQFAEGALYRELESALAAQDVTSAFEAAHTMKGVVANLSLQQLLVPLCSVVEILRSQRLPEEQEMKSFQDEYTLTLQYIRKIKEEKIILF